MSEAAEETSIPPLESESEDEAKAAKDSEVDKELLEEKEAQKSDSKRNETNLRRMLRAAERICKEEDGLSKYAVKLRELVYEAKVLLLKIGAGDKARWKKNRENSRRTRAQKQIDEEEQRAREGELETYYRKLKEIGSLVSSYIPPKQSPLDDSENIVQRKERVLQILFESRKGKEEGSHVQNVDLEDTVSPKAEVPLLSQDVQATLRNELLRGARRRPRRQGVEDRSHGDAASFFEMYEKEQEDLHNEMLNLTGALKGRAQVLSDALKTDKASLEALDKKIEENEGKLKNESKKIDKLTGFASSTCVNVLIVIFVSLLFLFTVAIITSIRKPSSQ
eukprot:CAMPEP_0113904528 /NCGR_PEP_ID=MMETSP0780_2-20120614/23315_1 /TAXON_ID=652834 /ORGANISM="Palpitomonas bilix" /LENGTH=335 /DNA_ID=CAMNT_0000898173 /DNA_START=192 /DNA_END=1199 /DNA_ORIENTATION=- /assembly_acc=CAM_ASM_000599